MLNRDFSTVIFIPKLVFNFPKVTWGSDQKRYAPAVKAPQLD